MGEWKTVFEDEVEDRWVTVKIYESEDDQDSDDDPAVRVTITPIDDDQGELDHGEKEQALPVGAEAADRSMTLEPDPVEDLEEELIEIGFSPEAAAWIVRKVPD